VVDHLENGLQHADDRAVGAVLAFVKPTQAVEMTEQLVGAVDEVNDHSRQDKTMRPREATPFTRIRFVRVQRIRHRRREVMSPHLFFSGVPCTGKSLLGGWLAKERGYIHIDAERKNGIELKEAGIYDEWTELVVIGKAKSFLAAIDRLKRPLILDWGFPVQLAFVLAVLQAEGFIAWWIGADRAMARKVFVKRGDIPVEAFDNYMREVERQWALVVRLFGERMICGLNANGKQRPPTEMWNEMLEKEARLGR
jgi:hypothetical protein